MSAGSEKNIQVATFGGGCFWCTEAIFQQLKGVEIVESGYSGGPEKNPTYQEVCAMQTGHAEVIQVTYDASVIAYEDLLKVHFLTHNPTTLNEQGNDVGPQYRSVVFYRSEQERQTAESVIAEMQAEFEDSIVTELAAFEEFYKAEGYHQRYFELNSQQPYCQMVIAPKVGKFKSLFKERLKS